MVLEQSPDPVVGHPDQPRHVGHRHRLAQRDHERLHQQRKARSRPCPGRLNLAGLAAGTAGHARQTRMNERLELEEMQVLPAPLNPVMDRLVSRPARRTRQLPGLAFHGKVDGALRLPEIHRGHRPRCAQTQRMCEESFHAARLPANAGSGKGGSTGIAIDPNMGVDPRN